VLSSHLLPARDFDALATGLGSAATIGLLRATQYSKCLLMLRAVLDAAERAGYKEAIPGIELLADVQRQAPGAVAEVLGYPLTGAWAAHCLRKLDAGQHTAADLAHLSGMAAAAAIRADVPFSIDVPVRNGAGYLPSLGRLSGAEGATVTVSSHGDAPLAGGTPLFDGPSWQPLRRITLTGHGQDLSVALDDMDPFRGGPRLPVAPRLSDREVQAWRDSLGHAWDILDRNHRDYSNAIGAGLTVIVPLVATQQNRGINATSRESFGAAAISGVGDPVTLAAGILHEFQHGKLNALLDLVPLHEADSEQYYAPWRQDPRPLSGLLHGAYAYLGVCDFWRVQAALSSTPFPAYARMEFARWPERTRQVVDKIAAAPSLTAAGRRFALGMQARLRHWHAPQAGEHTAAAWIASADHRLGWRLRNTRPDPDAISQLTQAWAARAAVPHGTQPHPVVVSGGSTLGRSTRLDLVYLRLRDPERFSQMAPGAGIEQADIDLVSGDNSAAAAGYLAVIGQDPGRSQAWAGLALALGSAAPALLHAPELVYAVYNALDDKPDPGTLAGWLAPVVPPDPYQVSDLGSPSRTRRTPRPAPAGPRGAQHRGSPPGP